MVNGAGLNTTDPSPMELLRPRVRFHGCEILTPPLILDVGSRLAPKALRIDRRTLYAGLGRILKMVFETSFQRMARRGCSVVSAGVENGVQSVDISAWVLDW